MRLTLLAACCVHATALTLRVGIRTSCPALPRAFPCLVDTEEVAKAEEPTEETPFGNELLIVAAAGTALTTVFHAPAFYTFFTQWQAIAASGVTGDDFWAPLQFWTFFAAMHPLLKPAIWIGEVLHTSPGPLLADFMPYSFIALNVLAIGLLNTLPRMRLALNVALLGLFLNFVGAGIEGTVDLADYNMALDDGVRGCPTYAQVKQPSMEGFDVRKYTGRWYEHAFHDYTQFSDVYDTTLDIELSADGGRWLDDFALRGPSPKAAPASWDKSPVANGAHYFLYGKLDAKEPGVLQESGFGVIFPNYIVDVQKDAEGRYTEAVQFQCLERGGVRIFEGINFLSREPRMSEEALAAMHDRARVAGMFPYGASPEQMHVVPHVPPDTPPLQNTWQSAWTAIGVDKLLALLETTTHSSFEDTSGIDK